MKVVPGCSVLDVLGVVVLGNIPVPEVGVEPTISWQVLRFAESKMPPGVKSITNFGIGLGDFHRKHLSHEATIILTISCRWPYWSWKVACYVFRNSKKRFYQAKRDPWESIKLLNFQHSYATSNTYNIHSG